MGAVWPRSNPPRGAMSPSAAKLVVCVSFFIVKTMLRSTFLREFQGVDPFRVTYAISYVLC